MKKKTPSMSQIEMREMVLPSHTNALNTAFGGVIMSWIDIAAAMCAAKHAESKVVTAHISDISFLNPISLGSHVWIRASVNYVGKTSMIIGVRVDSDNPYTGELKKMTKAYLTFVAVDDDSNPIPVSGLEPESEAEKRRYKNAKTRVENQKALLKTLKKSK